MFGFWRKRNIPLNHSQTLQPKFNKTILAISDLHDRENIPQLDERPDIVLCLGDIYLEDLERIDAIYDCPKLGVLGNHDAPDYFRGTSIINMHAKVLEVEGVTIAGFGGCLRYNTKNHGQYTEEECAAFLRTLGHIDIFIAHGNPKYEPETRDVAHAGFQSFIDYISEKHPAYFFHGHIHKPHVAQIGNTKVFSVYPHVKANLLFS